MDFEHLADLAMREIFRVTRPKENMSYEVVAAYQQGVQGRILSDQLIKLKTPSSQEKYPELMRRVVALVEVDGKEVVMEFRHLQNTTFTPPSIRPPANQSAL